MGCPLKGAALLSFYLLWLCVGLISAEAFDRYGNKSQA
jgi:hypothetical protein